MNLNVISKSILILLMQAGVQAGALAATLFENDFETGAMPAVDTPSPVWFIPGGFETVYGPGNFFQVTDISSHTGKYSLKITYEGRNGICNTCGSKVRKHKKGLDGVTYFVADTGEDLSLKDNPDTASVGDGPIAEPGKIIFNKTAGYSKWLITAVEDEAGKNDKLSVKLLEKGIGGEPAVFNGSDDVAITRQCGKDGNVSIVKGEDDVNRRVDCNGMVIWLGGIGDGQPPGTSIFRRQYLKQEVTTHFPLHQKLHYFRPNRNGTMGSVKGELVLIGKSEQALKDLGAPYPQTGLRHYGGEWVIRPDSNPDKGLPPDTKFERSVWYYVEEEYKASTFNNTTNEYNFDGEYRLWVSKSGEETNTPVHEATGLQLPGLSGGGGTHISLWGNVQHWINNRGSWYMDDIKISDTRVGWDDIDLVTNSGTNVPPPKSPGIP